MWLPMSPGSSDSSRGLRSRRWIVLTVSTGSQQRASIGPAVAASAAAFFGLRQGLKAGSLAASFGEEGWVMSEKSPNEFIHLSGIENVLEQQYSDLSETMNRFSVIPDFPIPPLPNLTMDSADYSEAEEFCWDLNREVGLLRSQLSETQELHVIVASPWGSPMRVASLAYRNPNMVIFRGERAEVITHVQSVQVMLVVVDPEPEEPEREPMGFRFVGNLDAVSESE